jgi:hypothetical protein
MDDLVTPQSHSEAALQQCLAQFSQDLSAKYVDDKQLPKRDGNLLEYLAMRKGGGHCYIGIRTYPEPLTASELDHQRVLLERIRQTQHTLLATLMDYRLESHGHYIVSGPVGACPLHDHLRQNRSVSFPAVCDFISLLVEALEAAREVRWPRCNLEPYALLLGELSEESICKGVCLPVPVLPGLELRKSAATALPATTQLYVPELARLVCQMLGTPQQQRYRPIAKVGAVTNQLLRFVLEQQWHGHLDSARTFALTLRKTAHEWQAYYQRHGHRAQARAHASSAKQQGTHPNCHCYSDHAAACGTHHSAEDTAETKCCARRRGDAVAAKTCSGLRETPRTSKPLPGLHA